MNIILLGAPGSGKGTQAIRLAEDLNLFYFQTGKFARELAEKDPRIKEIIDSGKLIPEQEVTMHVIDTLSKDVPNMRNILFDGFPRFISQYEALDEFLKSKGDDIDAIISLDISEEEAVNRISSRLTCEKCGTIYNTITNPPQNSGLCDCGGTLRQREDAKPEAVKVRFQFYRDNTEKMINHIDQKGKLIRINGELPIDEVYKEIIGKLKERGLVNET